MGTVVEFTIKTTAGNGCGAWVGYRRSRGSWGGTAFETKVADEEGLCQWHWGVADDALPGKAEFRATAEGYGDSRMTLETFYIEKCSQ